MRLIADPSFSHASF